MSILQNYTLAYDVNKGIIKNNTDIVFSMGDMNTSKITFLFQKGFVEQDITGYSARAYYITPSGEPQQQDGLIIEDSKVEVNIPSSALSEQGFYRLQVIVYNDNKKKAVMEVKYQVKDTLEGDYLNSENKLDLLHQLDNKIDNTYTKEEVDEKFSEFDGGVPNDVIRVVYSPTKPSGNNTLWIKTEAV